MHNIEVVQGPKEGKIEPTRISGCAGLSSTLCLHSDIHMCTKYLEGESTAEMFFGLGPSFQYLLTMSVLHSS